MRVPSFYHPTGWSSGSLWLLEGRLELILSGARSLLLSFDRYVYVSLWLSALSCTLHTAPLDVFATSAFIISVLHQTSTPTVRHNRHAFYGRPIPLVGWTFAYFFWLLEVLRSCMCNIFCLRPFRFISIHCIVVFHLSAQCNASTLPLFAVYSGSLAYHLISKYYFPYKSVGSFHQLLHLPLVSPSIRLFCSFASALMYSCLWGCIIFRACYTKPGPSLFLA